MGNGERKQGYRSYTSHDLLPHSRDEIQQAQPIYYIGYCKILAVCSQHPSRLAIGLWRRAPSHRAWIRGWSNIVFGVRQYGGISHGRSSSFISYVWQLWLAVWYKSDKL